MLASVITSKIAVQVNIGIVRAFVAVRQMITQPRQDKYEELKADIKHLRQEIEDILCDQNDTNEDTRMRLECIEMSLAELQNAKPHKPLPRIGFKTEE